MEPYKVKCLDAKYDQESEMLVLNCFFFSLDSPRLVVLSKSDFHFKQPGNPVPNDEMHKTAALFKNKEFNLIMNDDPNRQVVQQNKEKDVFREFSETISDELGKVSTGLADDANQIQRHLGRLMDDGKLDAKSLLERELAIRAKLGGV